jgi:hypothetical protein
MMSDNKSLLNRRRVFAAAGTAGALAAVAAVLPRDPAPAMAASPHAKPAPDANGGYRLTAHVQRYYETAKV